MTNAFAAQKPKSGRPHNNQTKSIIAAVLGNAMEFYDFGVYAAFAVALGHVFFPSTDPSISLLLSVATFGVGFVARPLGAIVMGAYADRYGRKPAMTMTILMMALGSGMIGLLPTFQQIGYAAPVLLIVARLIQGFSTGGEMGPVTAFLIESAARGRRGFAASWQASSQFMGSLLSGTVGIVLATTLPAGATEEWAWRVPFLIGVLIAPIGFYIRRSLEETLDPEQSLDSMSTVLSTVFKQHWRTILICIMMTASATVSTYFFLFGTTFAITSLGFSQSVAMAVTFTVGAVGVVFAIVGGMLSDRFDIKTVVFTARIIFVILLYPVMHFILSMDSPVALIAGFGFLMAIYSTATGAASGISARAFPVSVRTVGLSTSYALGVTLFGGTAQLVFTTIINTTGDKLSWIWYIVAMCCVGMVGLWLVRFVPDEPSLDKTSHTEKVNAGVPVAAGV
ncbi:MFS transporter [Phyllobacterium sp. OV277]|jgi:MFS family permease|uniref:MFS transporter n=1 Tax=Phyllobacterium sp. OV277 TaxID=1882772 RepID=UPI000888AA65|nr:MFS transporter [Phyllobacterium sp. OV277]SDP09978.1 Predicted arabinose efflux permease, MFS family [Phyllobacterium sp. OV277]